MLLFLILQAADLTFSIIFFITLCMATSWMASSGIAASWIDASDMAASWMDASEMATCWMSNFVDFEKVKN